MGCLPTIRSCALLPLAALLACSPAPDLSRPDDPLAGKIYEEEVVVTGAKDVTVTFFWDRLQITVPAAAYPAGTRVTLRVVDCRKLGESPVTLGRILVGWTAIDYGPSAALQILPALTPPAVPLPVNLRLSQELTASASNDSLDPLRNPTWGYDLLWARESDAALTTLARDQLTVGSGADRSVVFTIAEPGLWTVAEWPLPPSLQGRLDRVREIADTSVFLPESIEIVGRRYTWARTDSKGCVTVETGTMSSQDRDHLVFISQDGVTTSHFLTPETQGMWLDSKHFQLQVNPGDPLVASCPAGHGYDGGAADTRVDGGPRD